MKKNEKYEVQETDYGVTWINVLQKNSREETMKICITECKNCGGEHALPVLWYQVGYTKKIFKTYLCVDTYVYDSEGECRGDYNPTVLPSGIALDFTWLFENTPDNKQKLIDECFRRFEAADGHQQRNLIRKESVSLQMRMDWSFMTNCLMAGKLRPNLLPEDPFGLQKAVLL